jgi:CubicO group peptidase (beta-lactamase class C family)
MFQYFWKEKSMKRLYLAFLCSLLLIGAHSAAYAEEPQWLSPDGRESIQGLNITLPANPPRYLVAPDLTYERPAAAAIAPWPTADWSVSNPEDQGMDGAALDTAFDYAIAHGSKALVVIRNGYIVGEWYGPGWDRTTRQKGFSVAKSFSSAIVGMLIDAGAIASVDTQVAWYIPEWRDWQHRTVTVRNLLSMNSGLYWSNVNDYLILTTRPDQNAFAVGLPMQRFPGTYWTYNNAACQVLSELILNTTGGMQAADYAYYMLWGRIGMWNASWMTDRVGNTLTYQSVIASAREFAKFGYLYLRLGEWDGFQVVSSDWVLESTQPSHFRNSFYGYLWWLNTDGGMWPDAPSDAYAAMGMNEKKDLHRSQPRYRCRPLGRLQPQLGRQRLHWLYLQLGTALADGFDPPTRQMIE